MRAATPPLKVTVPQREVLDSLSRSQIAAHRDVQRAKALLMASDGFATTRVASELGLSPATVTRFGAILTDQTGDDIAVIERRRRQRARVEDRIRDDKDTGLSKLPFKSFAMNEVWVQIVMLAHDLIIWTQTLLLDGALVKAEPRTLRYRLLHVAGRLAFSGRSGKLHIQSNWPWVQELLAAFKKLRTLSPAPG